VTCQRHNSILIYRRRLRDLFRKSFWLACVKCKLEQGPYDKGIARLRQASE
jgi:hypothetical protein